MPQPQPWILQLPKTQIGLVVFRKQQSCLYLPKGSAGRAGPAGPLAAARELWQRENHTERMLIEKKQLEGMVCLSLASA